jgi:transcriptional regulator with XRE-family HTH domain
LSISPFGVYLRDARTSAGKSLREVADALGITHVYLGEVERGRRRVLPDKYWDRLVECLPAMSYNELETLAAASEPLDPSAMEGSSREVVVALARALEGGEMSDDLAKQLLAILKNRPGQ